MLDTGYDTFITFQEFDTVTRAIQHLQSTQHLITDIGLPSAPPMYSVTDDPPSYSSVVFDEVEFNRNMSQAFKTDNWQQVDINTFQPFIKLSDEEKLQLWNTLKTTDINFNSDIVGLTLKLARSTGCNSAAQFCEQINFVVDQLRVRAQNVPVQQEYVDVPLNNQAQYSTQYGNAPIPVILPIPTPGVTNTQAEFAATAGPQAPLKDDSCGDILCWWCLWYHWCTPSPAATHGVGGGGPGCCSCCCDNETAGVSGDDGCCAGDDGCCDCGDCDCDCGGADCGDCGIDF